MLKEELKKYNIILGSASPRRKELLAACGFDFKIETTDKQESYPLNLSENEIAEFLAQQKSNFISNNIKNNFLLITADTIVVHNNKILHKPKDDKDAYKILTQLSAQKHKVITGVCIKTQAKEVVFSTETEVDFYHLSEEEISFYITNYKPFDKAGSYGIQEWIGNIGIEKINGSYNNVVGLPTAELYQKLKLFI